VYDDPASKPVLRHGLKCVLPKLQSPEVPNNSWLHTVPSLMKGRPSCLTAMATSLCHEALQIRITAIALKPGGPPGAAKGMSRDRHRDRIVSRRIGAYMPVRVWFARGFVIAGAHGADVTRRCLRSTP